jgi:tetratricopeptide (TPR) repeat protein
MRFIALLFTLAMSTVFAAEVAVVIRTGGDVSKSNAQVDSALLKRRDTLLEGDNIITGPDAYATIRFSDQSVVDLGENSILAITRYQPQNTQTESKILLELLSGQLRTVTGSLAKDPRAFDLRTAHASIGVRGTEFEVIVLSATETQVQWHSGVVLVKSLAFEEDILELTEGAQRASVTLAAPAKLIDSISGKTLGAFTPSLLDLVNAIPTPPLLPLTVPLVAPAALPSLVPLGSDGETPTGIENMNEGPMEAFVTLVNNQNWLQARVLADELKNRFEGLPRFDLYHGILLMAEEQYDEAIFSFERVLIFTPDQHRARLELGRAYYLTQNYERAKDSLNQILAIDPPASVKSKVKTLLARVDEAMRRSQVQTNVGGGIVVGWDSNVNSGSNLEGTLDPNLLGLTELTSASEPIASLFTQWSFTTGLTKPTSQNAASQFTFDYTLRNYTEPNVSDTSAMTVFGSINSQSDRWRSQAPANAQFSWLAGNLWQASVDVSASQQYLVWGPLWAGVKVGTVMTVAISDANLSNAKDLAGIVFDAKERGRVHSLSSLYLQTSQAGQDDGHTEWRGFANRYQLAWSLPWNIQSNVSIAHEWRQYKADDLFFTVNDISTERKRRQDQIIRTDIQAGWAPTHWLQTQTSVSWEWVDSNINAYGRDRLIVSQALTIRF